MMKWPNVTPVQHFCSGFDHANHVSSSHGFIYLPKRLSNVYTFEYEHSKRFVRIDDNISAYNRKIGNQAYFPNGL